MARLSFKILPVSRVSEKERQEMFTVFSQYYVLPQPETFFRDFADKDDVIILYDKRTQRVKGFSTQKLLRHQINGKTYLGLFSGDTIIDREFWGDNTLGFAFFWYLIRLNCIRPWRRVYWHLISKGYKTYLLMTNNFAVYYPRYDQPTPAFFQALSDDFAHQLYPQAYKKELGLLIFTGPHERLKDHVAPITEELKLRHPHIRFFSEKNPHWERGDELVCIGEYHLFLPLSYAKKVFLKNLRRLFSPKAHPGVK